jgi:hypothetical protein
MLNILKKMLKIIYNILKKILTFKDKSLMQISESDNEFYSVFKKILEDITLNNKGKKLNETD